MMGNGNAVLEVFLMGGATPRLCKPDAYEYWHIAFDVDDVEEILKIINISGFERPHREEVRICE